MGKETGNKRTNIGIAQSIVSKVSDLDILVQNDFWIRRGIFEKLVLGIEDDEGNLAAAKYAKLHGLFNEPCLPLVESYVSIALVANRFNRNFFSSHVGCFYLYFSRFSTCFYFSNQSEIKELLIFRTCLGSFLLFCNLLEDVLRVNKFPCEKIFKKRL